MTLEQWAGVVAAVRQAWGPALARRKGWGEWESYYADPGYVLPQLDAATFHTAIKRMLERQTDGYPPTPPGLIAPIRAEWERRHTTLTPVVDEPPLRTRDPLEVFEEATVDYPEFRRRYLEWRGRHATPSP